MPWSLYPASCLAEHAKTWDDLQQRTTNVAFLETAFLLPLLEHFGSGQERLALCREDGRVVAAALVRRGGSGKWDTFQPSQLPLSPWLCELPADHLARAVSLMGSLPAPCAGLGLSQLDSMLQPRPQDGATVRTQDYIETAFIDVSQPFDDYWEARGKNLRQNTRKQRNKLLAESTQTRLDCVTHPDDVASAIAAYGRLESKGWKAANGTAVHADNAQGRFYTAMLRNFCALGRGRIYRYFFNEDIVSMDLCIDNGSTIVILKTAYDESRSAVSPSALMRQEEFRSIFDEGRYSRIEFYGKVMEWHTRWTDSRRGIYHLTCYRWAIVRKVHDFLKSRREAIRPVDAPA